MNDRTQLVLLGIACFVFVVALNIFFEWPKIAMAWEYWFGK